MDAGVPIKSPVAGIAMGLISDGPLTDPKTRIAILSDILGDEDHLGDMDFKVCGTKKGVTAIQMDIKIAGLSRDVLDAGARAGARGRALTSSTRCSRRSASRAPDLSKWAPRITQIKVKPDQIRLIIGPGGKTIKGIIDQTGVAIDVEDDGTVNVASSDSDAVKKALDIIKGLTTEPEVGAIYKGTVSRVADFGAFIEIMPGTDGLLHVSEMAHHRVEQGHRRDEGRRRGRGEGHLGRSRREDSPHAPRAPPFPEGAEGERAKRADRAGARAGRSPAAAAAVAAVGRDGRGGPRAIGRAGRR